MLQLFPRWPVRSCQRPAGQEAGRRLLGQAACGSGSWCNALCGCVCACMCVSDNTGLCGLWLLRGFLWSSRPSLCPLWLSPVPCAAGPVGGSGVLHTSLLGVIPALGRLRRGSSCLPCPSLLFFPKHYYLFLSACTVLLSAQ